MLADNLSVSSSPEYVSLSQNRSFRVLEVGASSIVGGESFLAYMVSTITSSAFSEVVVFYRDYDFCCINLMGTYKKPFWSTTEAVKVEEASRRHKQFEVLREMHRVRGFRLVLCVDVWDRVGEYAMTALKLQRRRQK